MVIHATIGATGYSVLDGTKPGPVSRVTIDPGTHILERIPNPYGCDAPWLGIQGTKIGDAEEAWRAWQNGMCGTLTDGIDWGESEIVLDDEDDHGKPPLILHFSIAVCRIARGLLSPQDLSRALFALDVLQETYFEYCDGWQPLDPTIILERDFSSEEAGSDEDSVFVREYRAYGDAIRNLLEAIVTAEQEGRVLWRGENDDMGSEPDLVAFLARHGHEARSLAPRKPLSRESMEIPYWSPDLYRRLRNAGCPVAVIQG